MKRKYTGIEYNLFWSLLWGFILVLGCSEQQENYYATLDRAKDDHAIQRGYIPSILPASAYEIYEQHFIDIDIVWIKFKFNVNEAPKLLEKLKRLNLEEIRSLGSEISSGPKWWPESLTKHNMRNAKTDFPFVVARYEYVIEYGENRQETKYGYFFLDLITGQSYYFGG